ncbi:hypothetical protein [Streptomyces sp. NPDC059080]
MHTECGGQAYKLIPRAHDMGDNQGGSAYEEQTCTACVNGWIEGGDRG